MMFENLRLLRNILLRSFLIGWIVALISSVIVIFAWDWWVNLSVQMFHTDEIYLSQLILAFFTVFKLILLCGALIPGLAIHWTLKAELRKQG